jgi:hypothetical protein
MNDNGKTAPKKQKRLIRWTAFDDMPRWQREMERMFGDFSEEKPTTPEVRDGDEKERNSSS